MKEEIDDNDNDNNEDLIIVLLDLKDGVDIFADEVLQLSNVANDWTNLHSVYIYKSIEVTSFKIESIETCWVFKWNSTLVQECKKEMVPP